MKTLEPNTNSNLTKVNSENFLDKKKSTNVKDNAADKIKAENADKIKAENADNIRADNADNIKADNKDTIKADNEDKIRAENADKIKADNAVKVVDKNNTRVKVDKSNVIKNNELDKKNDIKKDDAVESDTKIEKNINDKDDKKNDEPAVNGGDNKVYDEPELSEMNRLIKKHVIGSMGVGLIPMPIIDFVALTGIQLNLIKKLSTAYGIQFKKDRVKNIIGSLVGGAVPLPVGSALASFSKSIPVIGTLAGVLAMPITAGASTYAIGKVFLQHYATGGNLLNLDPEKQKAYYQEMFEEGKIISTSLHKEKE